MGAIIGPGRSGTTWAGVLVDSSPDVIYRFEPFHRMAAVDPKYRDWFDKLKRQAVREHDIPNIYSLLCRAHPLTNKPPFFPDKSYRQFTFGRSQAWPLVRVLPLANRLYEAIYSPRPGPPLIFKEVTFIKAAQNLLEQTSVPVVYLIRHPCATVLSEVTGQSEGKMSTGRQLHLREILQKYSPALAERFAGVVAGTDIVERAALLWRCEMETCVSMVRRSTNGKVLTYEQLVDDTYDQVKKLLAHLGVGFSDQTKQFIDHLYGLKSGAGQRVRRTGWGDKYFSIYRNPKEQKTAWKAKMSPRDQRKVESIVEDSPAVSYCAALGGW